MCVKSRRAGKADATRYCLCSVGFNGPIKHVDAFSLKGPYKRAHGQDNPKSSSWSAGNFLWDSHRWVNDVYSQPHYSADIVKHTLAAQTNTQPPVMTGLFRYHIQTQDINRWPLLSKSRAGRVFFLAVHLHPPVHRGQQ